MCLFSYSLYEKPIRDTEMRVSGVGTLCFILHAQGDMGKRSRQRNVAKEIDFFKTIRLG